MEITAFTLKIAARCNLNCSYCYVYNRADTTWQLRPPVMSDEIFAAAMERIRRYCQYTPRRSLSIYFHGGEPTLIGHKRFACLCDTIKNKLSDLVEVNLGMQTNGTLLDEEWLPPLLAHNVHVGVSIDGPKHIHDRLRPERNGKPSYENVVRGIKLLQQAKVPHRVLTVIPLGEDPISLHRHLVELGCSSITYLMPDLTHDEMDRFHRQLGPTPCADFLIPIFDDWIASDQVTVKIRDLWNICRLILGGRSQIETFGNRPPLYVFIESDGTIEGLDCLRSCENALSQTEFNVMHDDIAELMHTATMHSKAIFSGMPLPDACVGCEEQFTCAGGYLPHRYSKASGFNNPSVWCKDIMKLFAHVRRALGVTHEQTLALQRKANDRP